MGVIDRYAELLPVTERTPRITLGEGSTPLVRLDGISRMLEIELWAKLEGCNPSGSFKDRGMVMAVAKALEDGAKALVCASTETPRLPRQPTPPPRRFPASYCFRRGRSRSASSRRLLCMARRLSPCVEISTALLKWRARRQSAKDLQL